VLVLFHHQNAGAFAQHEAVATGVSTLVTTPEFRDYCPAFDPSGKYLTSWQPDPGFWGPRGIVVASGPGISTIRATVDGATSTVDVTVTLPAELVTPRMAPALSGPEVQVNNGTNKDVNVFVSLNNTDTFLGRVRAGSSLTLPVRAFAAGSTVALKAVTVDGSRTYSRSNVVLNGTYVFPIP
jgi:hypothetical protein